MEVASAWNREEDIWNAILNCEHIWCQSYFIGDSAHLFICLLEKAVREGVRDKSFFDLAERWEAVYHLLGVKQDIKGYMIWLEQHRNIKFFFWEEIGQMMGLTTRILV
ncbi:MAG TPA: hypothetical protein VHE34_06380 [Puia sp.]|nr:hypothetical protein [Puia sp.]